MERMRNKDLENAWAVQGIRQEKCAKLEEENKKLEKENGNLKEELFNIKRNTKYNWLQDTLVYDDSKTAIEQGARAYEAELHNRYVSELEEENKKLKSDLAYERTMLDNVRAEYKSSQNVIKKLKETIKDHQLYEEKLEHRIIELEELLHGE